MIKQFLKGLVTKVNDDYTLEVAVASTGKKDRQGEIIEPTAWRLDNFKRNPVLQWAHNYSNLPIGKIEEISIIDDKLMFKPRFAAEIDEFAKKVWQMYKEGFLNAFSVGFNPLSELKDGKWTDVELLEISGVPVPANPDALVVARSLGIELKDSDDVDAELKPEPEIIGDFIHIRVRDPNLFVEDSFRTIDISEREGIKAVIGKLKSDPNGSTVVQKYLFDKEKWSIEEAVDWVNEHKSKDGEAGEVKPEATPEVTEGAPEAVEAVEATPEPPAEPPEPKMISEVNREKIKLALDNIKITADALQSLLQNSETSKDNVGVPKAGSDNVSEHKQALIIARSALKHADKRIEAANRAIKIVLNSN